MRTKSKQYLHAELCGFFAMFLSQLICVAIVHCHFCQFYIYHLFINFFFLRFVRNIKEEEEEIEWEKINSSDMNEIYADYAFSWTPIFYRKFHLYHCCACVGVNVCYVCHFIKAIISFRLNSPFYKWFGNHICNKKKWMNAIVTDYTTQIIHSHFSYNAASWWHIWYDK